MFRYLNVGKDKCQVFQHLIPQVFNFRQISYASLTPGQLQQVCTVENPYDLVLCPIRFSIYMLSNLYVHTVLVSIFTPMILKSVRDVTLQTTMKTLPTFRTAFKTLTTDVTIFPSAKC